MVALSVLGEPFSVQSRIYCGVVDLGFGTTRLFWDTFSTPSPQPSSIQSCCRFRDHHWMFFFRYSFFFPPFVFLFFLLSSRFHCDQLPSHPAPPLRSRSFSARVPSVVCTLPQHQVPSHCDLSPTSARIFFLACPSS